MTAKPILIIRHPDVDDDGVRTRIRNNIKALGIDDWHIIVLFELRESTSFEGMIA